MVDLGHAQLASKALSLLFLQPEEVAQEAAEEPLIEPLMEPEGESYEEQPQVRGGALGIPARVGGSGRISLGQ